MPNVAILPHASPVVGPLVGVVDGWPAEQHTLKTSVGGEPVEDGTKATDHAVFSSEEVTLTGYVSDWSGGGAPGNAWAEIRRLNATLEPITLITEWGTYNSMLIEEASAPKRGRNLRFTLKFVWRNIVGVTDAELPEGEVSGPASGRSGEVSRGRVATPPPSPLVTGPAVSPAQPPGPF